MKEPQVFFIIAVLTFMDAHELLGWVWAGCLGLGDGGCE